MEATLVATAITEKADSDVLGAKDLGTKGRAGRERDLYLSIPGG